MRKRFRGNKPISVSPELEGGSLNEATMLYAGKGTYEGSGPRTTDGRDAEMEREEYERFVRNDGTEDWRKK